MLLNIFFSKPAGFAAGKTKGEPQLDQYFWKSFPEGRVAQVGIPGTAPSWRAAAATGVLWGLDVIAKH